MSEKSALMVLSEVSALYPSLTPEGSKIFEVFKENLGPNDSLSAWDLDTVRVPAGGGLSFNVPVLGDENGEDVRSIEGVIVGVFDRRVYWEDRDSVDGNAPDCQSNDAMVGVGDPGGFCADCPFAEYGSAVKGKGQACKQIKQLFILRQGTSLPVKLNVPPSSLKNIRRYLINLSANGVSFYGGATQFSLTKVKNADGIDYSEIVVKLAKRFDADTVAELRGQVEMFRPIFEAVPITTGHGDGEIAGAEISD